ncbi:Alpha-(1,3)-fucosyltransferase 7 [Desmophyllum pertusum]|uniref:Alpha-(1,3)-fucosyltransferase 7 n=1 Tax=Desmophyllum pertusum TaxID=174260 RepID=A0A9W9ZVS0_9CNID|nr:Alpha-(1,3)-fucosyltransferase 7 [Desmophyllum pertusum]
MKNAQRTIVNRTSQNDTKSWLIVYWSTFFGRRLNLHERWKKGECPVPCEITSNQSRASEADGLVIHARDPIGRPPVESVPWILQIRENPIYTPVLKDAKFMSKFNFLKSYRLDSDFPDPSVKLPNLTPPTPFKNKGGFIMAALSNCEPVRTEYMRQLMKFVQV